MQPKEASHAFLNATTAHDDYLQAAVESGPIALVLMVLALGGAVRRHLRARQRGLAAATLACAVCALADSPLRQPAVVIALAFSFAALRPSRVPAASGPRTLQRLAAPALLVACGLLLAASARSWLGARLRTRANDELLEARVATLARAALLDPASGETALDLGLARLEIGDAEGALASLERARRLLANVGTSIAMGNAQLALGRADLAEAAYREALAWNPGSFRAQADLADALRVLGRFDEAEARAKIALSLSPGDERVRELIDRIHRERMEVGVEVE
jgi:tetratricopeptide (TPR) repeat protein